MPNTKAYKELMMKQDNLVSSNIDCIENHEIQDVSYNSKEIKEDGLFICKGAAFKEEYLKEAMKQGILCYMSEKQYNVDCPCIIVKDIRKAMPLVGSLFYQHPNDQLHIIGVGGTKGKSTTVYYMKAILDDYMKAIHKKETAVISSIDVYDGVIKKESHITTPEAIELQQHFSHALKSGIDYLQMEVSSQALKYNRVDGITFDVGVFLNISEDHISPIEHPDFEDYFQSKLRLFKQSKVAVVNLDADYASRIVEAAQVSQKVITFSIKDPKADIYASDVHKVGHGSAFTVTSKKYNRVFELTMPGLFNVENALAVIAVSEALDIPEEYVYSGLKRARSSGRMELYASSDNKIVAIVDYAHNKLSFEKLFSSTKEEYPDREILSIFGCPGKKALLRRKDLGTVAGTYAKKVYLTAEDPGAEPVDQISKDIAQYVEKTNCPYEMIEDRGEAIHAAIQSITKPTVILITGKGNETRQKYGSEYLDCPSDVDYVKKYLEEYNQKAEG